MSVCKEKILIVEDNALVGMDLADIVTELGYEPAGPAFTVSEALGLIEEGGVTAALLDYDLGNETSLPVAWRSRELGVPFVFVSGAGETIRQIATKYAALVVEKPLNTKALANQLNNAISTAD